MIIIHLHENARFHRDLTDILVLKLKTQGIK